MQNLLIESGISASIILILFMLPVVATLIGFTRHILGLRSLGIYLSILLTFILFKIGNIENSYKSDIRIGFTYGIPLIILIFTSTLFYQWLVKKISMHYYPKLSLVIFGVTATLIASIIILSLLGIKNILLLDTFTLVLAVAVSEKYFSLLSRKNYKTTIFISLESLIIASLCYLLISWEVFQTIIINRPLLLLLLIPINIMIGKFTGLRLSEQLRFWGILTEK